MNWQVYFSKEIKAYIDKLDNRFQSPSHPQKSCGCLSSNSDQKLGDEGQSLVKGAEEWKRSDTQRDIRKFERLQ